MNKQILVSSHHLQHEIQFNHTEHCDFDNVVKHLLVLPSLISFHDS